MNDELYHHGIKGQKWGQRRFQNPDGSLTTEGRAHYNVGPANGEGGSSSGNTSSSQGKKSSGGIDKQKLKTGLKVGAALAATGLAAYGAYKLHEHMPEINRAAKLMRTKDFFKANASSVSKWVSGKGPRPTMDNFRSIKNKTIGSKFRNSAVGKVIDAGRFAYGRSGVGKTINNAASNASRFVANNGRRVAGATSNAARNASRFVSNAGRRAAYSASNASNKFRNSVVNRAVNATSNAARNASRFVSNAGHRAAYSASNASNKFRNSVVNRAVNATGRAINATSNAARNASRKVRNGIVNRSNRLISRGRKSLY